MAQASTVLPPAWKEQVSTALQTGAQIVTNTQLQHRLVHQLPAIRAEIVGITTDARMPDPTRPTCGMAFG